MLPANYKSPIPTLREWFVGFAASKDSAERTLGSERTVSQPPKADTQHAQTPAHGEKQQRLLLFSQVISNLQKKKTATLKSRGNSPNRQSLQMLRLSKKKDNFLVHSLVPQQQKASVQRKDSEEQPAAQDESQQIKQVSLRSSILNSLQRVETQEANSEHGQSGESQLQQQGSKNISLQQQDQQTNH